MLTTFMYQYALLVFNLPTPEQAFLSLVYIVLSVFGLTGGLLGPGLGPTFSLCGRSLDGPEYFSILFVLFWRSGFVIFFYFLRFRRDFLLTGF